MDQCKRLEGGMSKIIEASVQLNILNGKLEVQKVAVAAKTEACEKLLEEISTRTAEAKDKKELAEKKSTDIEEQNKGSDWTVVVVNECNLDGIWLVRLE